MSNFNEDENASHLQNYLFCFFQSMFNKGSNKCKYLCLLSVKFSEYSKVLGKKNQFMHLILSKLYKQSHKNEIINILTL